MSETLCAILTDLTGKEPSTSIDVEEAVNSLMTGSGIGHSQLNELLLLLGYDRVSLKFFQYLISDACVKSPKIAFGSLDELRKGVEAFRKLAILRFGNVKFGFKHLSSPSTDLEAELALFDTIDEERFSNRHDPLTPIEPIPGDQAYLLGYLIKDQLEKRLRDNPNDNDASRLLQERERLIEKGKRNHRAYLASDHMDVYVATSMREKHEYQMVNKVVTQIFASPSLHKLKLRWFDPTQACCDDRIDKGLAEGLMLKRAACTLYLAQESDTLGKDSELASTLAQGKPVIAYIPSVSGDEAADYVDDLLAMIAEGCVNITPQVLILQQLRSFKPKLAWEDPEVAGWVQNPSTLDVAVGKARLARCISEHYDERAKMLKENHPLGVQVHLETGVANGVLVSRTTSQCSDLIRRILTSTLDFEIVEKHIQGNRYLLLKETTTDSVFRVVSGDRFLTKVFWNFYLA